MEHPAIGHPAAGSSARQAHAPYGTGHDGGRPQDTAAEWRHRIDAVADRPADDGFSFWRQPERPAHPAPPPAAPASPAAPSAPASQHAPGAPSDLSPAAPFGPAPAAGQASAAMASAARTASPPVPPASPIQESPTYPSLTPPRAAKRPVAAWETAQPDPAPQPEPEARAEAAPEDKPSRPKRRDPYLDNVKFVLIALVVTGHSLVPTLAADSARAAYIFIYTFHMPAFVLISGYLSRNFWHSTAKINKLVDTLLIPYAVVEVGYALLRVATGEKWSLTITDPAWLNWYLVALVLWRISTPVWTRMRYPLLIAVLLYLIAGFSEISGDFSIDRFFGLLPFYVLGLLLKPEHFEYLNRLWVKIAAVCTLAGAAVVAIVIAPGSSLKPFYYKNSYLKMGLEWYEGIGLRLALLAAALAMTASLLALVPRRETWFSDLGTRTLYAYLLHGVPVMIAKSQGWLSFPWMYGPLGVLSITSICFALTILLCLPETRAIFKWALEPRLTWLYRQPSR